MILYNNAIRAYVNVFLKHNILPHKCIHKCVSYFFSSGNSVRSSTFLHTKYYTSYFGNLCLLSSLWLVYKFIIVLEIKVTFIFFQRIYCVLRSISIHVHPPYREVYPPTAQNGTALFPVVQA